MKRGRKEEYVLLFLVTNVLFKLAKVMKTPIEKKLQICPAKKFKFN